MRLNCGIPPANLTDEHLFAESRELKMLPSVYERVGDKNKLNVPEEFTLGKGHMLFFLYKNTYTLLRYGSVFLELKSRGYNIKYEGDRWKVYYACRCRQHYEETGKEAVIVKQHIIEKIQNSTKKFFHYNHEKITKEDAIKLLNNYEK